MVHSRPAIATSPLLPVVLSSLACAYWAPSKASPSTASCYWLASKSAPRSPPLSCFAVLAAIRVLLLQLQLKLQVHKLLSNTAFNCLQVWGSGDRSDDKNDSDDKKLNHEKSLVVGCPTDGFWIANARLEGFQSWLGHCIALSLLNGRIQFHFPAMLFRSSWVVKLSHLWHAHANLPTTWEPPGPGRLSQFWSAWSEKVP